MRSLDVYEEIRKVLKFRSGSEIGTEKHITENNIHYLKE